MYKLTLEIDLSLWKLLIIELSQKNLRACMKM